MKLLRRFGAFTLRFWPLWAPWILALLLPFSRPIARIWSDPLGSGIVEFFSRNYDNRGPMPAADKYPADFDLKLWHLLNGEGGFSGGDYFRMRYGQNLDLSAVSRVRKRFPNETLLYALPVQNALGIRFWNQYYGSQSNSNGTQAQARALAPLVERGRQLEPGNALWWLARAQIEWRLGRRDQTLAALERAARSPYYDDKTLEIARRVIAARERYDAPLWASRREMLAGLRGFEAELQINAGSAWSSHGLNLQKRGDVAGALRWSGALAAIGDLMQRDPNAPSTLRVGRSWQKYAWRAGNPAGTRGKLLPNGAQTFAAYAAQNGRPDLASATNSQNARGQAVEKIVGSYARWQYYRDEPWLKAGGLQARMELLEGAAAAAVAMVFYLAVWWMAANIFGWRARGAPSSRAARMGLPTVITLLLATLAGACGWWFLTVQGPTVGPTPMLGQVVGGTLSGFAAVSAPFLLALGCAGWTLWRHRAQFSPSPRVDMELALAPWARLLLRWFLPLGVIASIAVFVGGWALWIAAIGANWGKVDLLALLPPDRKGYTGSLIWDITTLPVPLIYGGLMCCVCLLVWFVKWRWLSAPELRPYTHGALRWWKECLGGAIAALGWLFLLVALASWPLRRSAETRLGSVLKNGDLTVVRAVGK